MGQSLSVRPWARGAVAGVEGLVRMGVGTGSGRSRPGRFGAGTFQERPKISLRLGGLMVGLKQDGPGSGKGEVAGECRGD